MMWEASGGSGVPTEHSRRVLSSGLGREAWGAEIQITAHVGQSPHFRGGEGDGPVSSLQLPSLPCSPCHCPKREAQRHGPPSHLPENLL